MAKEKPNNERTEREFQLDVNQAVANTEGEIFEDALDDKPLDNDGDTSLEEMGEGLEGDDLEDEEGPDEEADEEEADEEGEGEEESDGETGDRPDDAEAAEDDEEDQPRDQQGRFEDRQPPDRREIPLKAERDRRREAEERAAENERKLAEALGRIDELSRRVNAPPPQVERKQAEVPDMFADPDGYRRYLREENERFIEERLMQAQQERVNVNLNAYANSEEGRRFHVAYNRLLSVAPTNPALVRSVWNSHDPGKQILDWFKDHGGSEFDEQERQRVAKEYERYFPQEERQQNSRQRSQQPRHETRLPESLRRTGPPSLNSARGGQRQEVQDPEMMDDSDDAVMRYAMRQR